MEPPWDFLLVKYESQGESHIEDDFDCLQAQIM